MSWGLYYDEAYPNKAEIVPEQKIDEEYFVAPNHCRGESCSCNPYSEISKHGVEILIHNDDAADEEQVTQ